MTELKYLKTTTMKELGSTLHFLYNRIRSTGQLWSVKPPRIHLSSYLTGGLKKLYHHLKNDCLSLPVYRKGQFTNDEGHFFISGSCVMASRYRIIDLISEKGQSGVLLRAEDMFKEDTIVETLCLQQLRTVDPDNISHTLRLLNIFTFDDHYCMVFEALYPEPINRIFHQISRDKLIPSIRKVTIRLLTILGFLQQQNVIHADLKPDNILLKKKDDLGSLKVIDFGNAIHHIHKEVSLYYEDFEVQTPLYRAPEVIFGIPFGSEIDIWSVGCILAELYAGKPLFLGGDEKSIVKKMTEILGLLPTNVFQKGKFYSELKGFTGPNTQENVGQDLMDHLKCRDYKFCSFLAGCLQYNPDKRFKPREAALHPFLASELPIGFLMGSNTDKLYPSVYVPHYSHSPHVASDIQRSQPSSLDLLKLGTSIVDTDKSDTSSHSSGCRVAIVDPLRCHEECQEFKEIQEENLIQDRRRNHNRPRRSSDMENVNNNISSRNNYLKKLNLNDQNRNCDNHHSEIIHLSTVFNKQSPLLRTSEGRDEHRHPVAFDKNLQKVKSPNKNVQLERQNTPKQYLGIPNRIRSDEKPNQEKKSFHKKATKLETYSDERVSNSPQLEESMEHVNFENNLTRTHPEIKRKCRKGHVSSSEQISMMYWARSPDVSRAGRHPIINNKSFDNEELLYKTKLEQKKLITNNQDQEALNQGHVDVTSKEFSTEVNLKRQECDVHTKLMEDLERYKRSSTMPSRKRGTSDSDRLKQKRRRYLKQNFKRSEIVEHEAMLDVNDSACNESGPDPESLQPELAKAVSSDRNYGAMSEERKFSNSKNLINRPGSKMHELSNGRNKGRQRSLDIAEQSGYQTKELDKTYTVRRNSFSSEVVSDKCMTEISRQIDMKRDNDRKSLGNAFREKNEDSNCLNGMVNNNYDDGNVIKQKQKIKLSTSDKTDRLTSAETGRSTSNKTGRLTSDQEGRISSSSARKPKIANNTIEGDTSPSDESITMERERNCIETGEADANRYLNIEGKRSLVNSANEKVRKRLMFPEALKPRKTASSLHKDRGNIKKNKKFVRASKKLVDEDFFRDKKPVEKSCNVDKIQVGDSFIAEDDKNSIDPYEYEMTPDAKRGFINMQRKEERKRVKLANDKEELAASMTKNLDPAKLLVRNQKPISCPSDTTEKRNSKSNGMKANFGTNHIVGRKSGILNSDIICDETMSAENKLFENKTIKSNCLEDENYRVKLNRVTPQKRSSEAITSIDRNRRKNVLSPFYQTNLQQKVDEHSPLQHFNVQSSNRPSTSIQQLSNKSPLHLLQFRREHEKNSSLSEESSIADQKVVFSSRHKSSGKPIMLPKKFTSLNTELMEKFNDKNLSRQYSPSKEKHDGPSKSTDQRSSSRKKFKLISPARPHRLRNAFSPVSRSGVLSPSSDCVSLIMVEDELKAAYGANDGHSDSDEEVMLLSI
ncbi:DYRK2_3_4 [Mytilus coruscus]|uniref:DYRK2_3_4 n=1 Tax=Mytilus coruscus TaxID=42192 RepID=A0A6J8DBK0_MYTCO|nr:DYRK2_3_4 [Mytilus coruscus]